MYEYKAKLDRVVDGDTVDFHIDLGFDVWLNNTRVRLHHVDTPEKRTSDPLEKLFGYLSSDFVMDKLMAADTIVIKTELVGGRDKYGRILGTIWCDDDELSINDQLIALHYAVKYEGQNKSLIEEAHINNYKTLVEAGTVTLSAELTELYNQL
jgi:micrococcal nuclease